MCLRQQHADFIKHADPCCRDTASGTLHGTLIQQQHVFNMLAAFYAIYCSIAGRSDVELQATAKVWIQRINNQRTLTAATDPGDRTQHAERNSQRKVFNVVTSNISQRQPMFRFAPWLRRRWHRDRTRAHMLRCRGIGVHEFTGRALKCNPATGVSGTGTNFDNVVSRKNKLPIVLHHHHGVAALLKFPHGCNDSFCVGRMETGGRFIKDIQRVDQTGTQRRCKRRTLRLTAGKCPHAAIERQIVHAAVFQERQPSIGVLESWSQRELQVRG